MSRKLRHEDLLVEGDSDDDGEDVQAQLSNKSLRIGLDCEAGPASVSRDDPTWPNG